MDRRLASSGIVCVVCGAVNQRKCVYLVLLVTACGLERSVGKFDWCSFEA